MRLFFDANSLRKVRHPSGLQRVARRLLEGLQRIPEIEVMPLQWSGKAYRRIGSKRLWGAKAPPLSAATSRDVLFLPTLFSESERPGHGAVLKAFPGRRLALFHDDIPLRYPELCRPRSVARHPLYLRELASFDHVLSVSAEAARQLQHFWNEERLQSTPPITPVPPGSDSLGHPRITQATPPAEGPFNILCLGQIEPRKGQDILLSAAKAVASHSSAQPPSPRPLALHFVGRINETHGQALARSLKAEMPPGLSVQHYPKLRDDHLLRLIRQCHLSVIPSRLEGNGLAVLESLWLGLPVISTPIPAAVEWAGNAPVLIPHDDPAALGEAIRQLRDDHEALAQARQKATQAPLVTWDEAAQELAKHLTQI